MRRSRLPRIQLKALEEPAFAPISVKPASQLARKGPPSGRGGWATSRAKESLPCAPTPASGHIRASRALANMHG